MRATFARTLSAFRRDQSGATAIEYGLIAALMAIAIVAALFSLGNANRNMFSAVTNAVNAAHSGN